MIRLTRIIGASENDEIAQQLHAIEHRGRLEEIVLERGDLARRRLRARTSTGTDCAIALPRIERLFDGAVLLLEDERAIVVRMEPERWLSLAPSDAAAALELGYFAGNMHWRVRFEGRILHIALEDEEQEYLSRLRPLMEKGGVRRRGHG